MDAERIPAAPRVQELWIEVARLANGMLNRSIGITEGSRRLAEIRFQLDAETDPDFLPFAGIDSETDQYPLGPWRSLWNCDALARYDADREAAEEHFREFASQACRKLLQRYEKTA